MIRSVAKVGSARAVQGQTLPLRRVPTLPFRSSGYRYVVAQQAGPQQGLAGAAAASS